MIHHGECGVDPAVGRAEKVILWLGLIVAASLVLAGLVAGGVFSGIAWGGAEAIPVVTLAVLAHLGRDHAWARVLAWWCGGLLLFLLFLFGFGAFVGEDPEDFPEEVGRVFFVLMIACLIFLPLLSPWVRTRFSRAMGLQIDTPAAHFGLFMTVALSLLLFAPLVGTGKALLIELLKSTPAENGEEGMNPLLTLAWTLPMSFVLVGFGITRSARETWERLGLQWRGRNAILAGLGLGIGLVPLALFVHPFLAQFLESLGAPILTDEDIELLFSISTITPLLALGISLSAGIGEELSFRGALQPRVGILLSNTLFTALHSWQYTWDGVLIVFVVGLCMALLRRRFGTLASITAHVTYDLILFSLAIA